MPVYEYECRACQTRFSRFFRSVGAADSAVPCTSCGAAQTQRMISSFQVHQTLKTQIDKLDPTFERQIDSVMRPHLATDPLNNINMDFDSAVER